MSSSNTYCLLLAINRFLSQWICIVRYFQVRRHPWGLFRKQNPSITIISVNVSSPFKVGFPSGDSPCEKKINVLGWSKRRSNPCSDSVSNSPPFVSEKANHLECFPLKAITQLLYPPSTAISLTNFNCPMPHRTDVCPLFHPGENDSWAWHVKLILFLF